MRGFCYLKEAVRGRAELGAGWDSCIMLTIDEAGNVLYTPTDIPIVSPPLPPQSHHPATIKASGDRKMRKCWRRRTGRARMWASRQ